MSCEYIEICCLNCGAVCGYTQWPFGDVLCQVCHDVEAQNIAFAHMIRALNPEEISVTEARPGDLFWDEEASFEKQA